MKIRSLLLVTVLSTSTLSFPALAQTEGAPSTPAAAGAQSYDEVMKQAEAKLQQASDDKVAFQSEAMMLFNRAQRIAPDDAKKAEALIRKGETEVQLNAFAMAVVSFATARKLPTISNAQKARANFGYAFSRHQAAKSNNKIEGLFSQIFSDYEVALALAELDAPQRLQAHEALAELWLIQKRPLDAALEYEKILALPNAQNDALKKTYLVRALAGLKNEKASPRALEAVNSLNQKLKLLPQTDAETAQFKDAWADLLEKQNDRAGAIKFWDEIAGSPKFTLDARAKALRDIHKNQMAQKNWDAALQTADRLSTLPGVTSHYLALRFRDRAAVFIAQQQEAKARAEWSGILGVANVLAEDKAIAWSQIAASFQRERTVAQPKADVPALLAGQKEALENAWKVEGALRRTRVIAMLDRAQLDLEANDTQAASTRLLEVLKVVEPWEDTTGEAMSIKRELYFALAAIYHSEQSYSKAIAALIIAQKFSGLGDDLAAQSAVEVSDASFFAKKWDEARVVLLALKNVWGLPERTYFLKLAHIEVGAKNWAEAKKALANFDAATPTDEQKIEAQVLRKQIAAAP